MTDDLSSLVPGGSMIAGSLGLLGWFVKNAKDTQAEWRELLKTERADRVRDLADERERHERSLTLEHDRAEKHRAATDAIESDLRRRLADAETAARGWKDEAADASRRASWWRAEYTRISGTPPPADEPPLIDPFARGPGSGPPPSPRGGEYR